MNNTDVILERVGALDVRLNELEARVKLIESAPAPVQPSAEAKSAAARVPAAPRFDPLLLPKPAAQPVSPPETPSLPSFAPPQTPPNVELPSVEPSSAPRPPAAPSPPSPPRPPIVPPSAPSPSAPSPSQVSVVAQPLQSAPQAGDSLLDWEQLVGGKWALWAGLLSLFGAMASFLAYTWRFLPPPPPEAKVAMGVGAGVAFLVAGEWVRGRAQKWFGEGLSGAGLALCFLSLWAGAGYFGIFPVAPTFGAMALVVALGVWLALRHNAPGLNILSVIGGFATPVLLQKGGAASGGALDLLFYLAVLNAGVLGVSLFKRWRVSIWLSFGATVILLFSWSLSAPVAAMRGTVGAFYSLFFLLYFGAACFYSLARREDTAPEDAALLLSASALYALAGHDLLWPILGEFPGAFALGLAVFFGAVCALAARWAPANRLLREGTGALGLLALTVAVPIQFAQPWIGIGWIGEAGVLLWLARRSGSAFLNRAGQIVWVTALIPLGWEMFSPGDKTVWGLHNGGWPWLFALAISAWNAGALHRQNDGSDEDWKDVYALFGVLGGAWLVAREVALQLGGAGQIWLVLLALSFYAVATFGVGALSRFASVRLGATALAVGAGATVLWWTGHTPDFDLTPFWNARWAALVGTWGALGAIYALARAVDFPLHAAEKELARLGPPGAFGTALLAFSSELYLGFGHFAAPDWTSRAFFALSIVWALAALGLLARALQTRDGLARACAYLVGSVAVAALLIDALTMRASWLPFANWRAGAFAVAIAVAGVAAWRLHRAKAELSEGEADLPGALAGVALGLALWMLTQETWEAGRYFAVAGSDWQHGAQMAISLVWSLFGALLLAGGVTFRVQVARLGALALLAATVCKVFLFDLSFLDGASRALSLAGLGVALVFISWLYGRFGRAGATG